MLNFEGVNYSAKVWVNGTLVGENFVLQLVDGELTLDKRRVLDLFARNVPEFRTSIAVPTLSPARFAQTPWFLNRPTGAPILVAPETSTGPLPARLSSRREHTRARVTRVETLTHGCRRVARLVQQDSAVVPADGHLDSCG